MTLLSIKTGPALVLWTPTQNVLTALHKPFMYLNLMSRKFRSFFPLLTFALCALFILETVALVIHDYQHTFGNVQASSTVTSNGACAPETQAAFEGECSICLVYHTRSTNIHIFPPLVVPVENDSRSPVFLTVAPDCKVFADSDARAPPAYI